MNNLMKTAARIAFMLIWLIMATATGYTQQPLVYKTINEAAEKGDLADVKRHLENGSDVNAKDFYGWTPLMRAADNGDLSMVKYLTGKGADVKASSKDCRTPLDIAACQGKLEVVKYLVTKGADVNSRNKEGYTPLGTAAIVGNLDVIKYLVDKGADVNAQNLDGYTPLGAAAFMGKLDVVKCLLDKGADVNAKHKKGGTPLDFATLKGHLDVVKYLVAKGAVLDANGATLSRQVAAENAELSRQKAKQTEQARQQAELARHQAQQVEVARQQTEQAQQAEWARHQAQQAQQAKQAELVRQQAQQAELARQQAELADKIRNLPKGIRPWTAKDGRIFAYTEYFELDGDGRVWVWAPNETPGATRNLYLSYDKLCDKDQAYIQWVNKMEFRTWTFKNGNIANASSVHRMSDDYQRVYVWNRDQKEYWFSFDELSPNNWVGNGWAEIYAKKVNRQINQSPSVEPRAIVSSSRPSVTSDMSIVDEPLPMIIFTFILTWVVGLGPALIFRYVIIRQPLSRTPAIIMAAVFYIINILILVSDIIFSPTRGKHFVQVLIAWAIYGILVNGSSKKVVEHKSEKNGL